MISYGFSKPASHQADQNIAKPESLPILLDLPIRRVLPTSRSARKPASQPASQQATDKCRQGCNARAGGEGGSPHDCNVTQGQLWFGQRTLDVLVRLFGIIGHYVIIKNNIKRLINNQRIN